MSLACPTLGAEGSAARPLVHRIRIRASPCLGSCGRAQQSRARVESYS
jgi:hypothetical protein